MYKICKNIDCQKTLYKTCLSCQKFSEKIKYFLTVHYFVVIMSTLAYCAYINVFISHYNWIFKTSYCVIYIDWIGLDIPWNLLMCRLVDYKELCHCISHLAEKYTRYQHHIIFISNYIKQWKIPKGFRLKFHCNMANLEYEDIIKKCSLKLMQRTTSNCNTQY